MSLKGFLYKKIYPSWKGKWATRLKRRRINIINKKMNNCFSEEKLCGRRILEIGCGTGKDFVQHFNAYRNLEIYGIDIVERERISQENFIFVKGDAENIPFPDNYFDMAVSIGMLEHIDPIEKLCKVISEIDRVSRTYAIVVPSLGTILEPHTINFFWQIRPYGKKLSSPHLNYLSDEAWTKFKGFSEAKTARFWYIPMLISNILIYKADDSSSS